MRESMNSKPFIFCAQQRSGTTVLQRTLNESTSVHNLGEVFHELRMEEADSYFNFKLKRIRENDVLAVPSVVNQEILFNKYLHFLSTLSKKKFFLIDIKYNSWHHFDPFWHAPLEMPLALQLIKKNNFKILHIIRKNVFRQYLSSELAIHRRKWHYRPGEEIEDIENSIHINPLACLEAMEKSIKHTDLFSKWLAGYAHTEELLYEDIFRHGEFSDRVFSTISNLLGEDIEMPKTPELQKIVSDPKRLIANKDEVLNFFKTSVYNELVESTLS